MSRQKIEEELEILSNESLKALEKWAKNYKISVRGQLKLAEIILKIHEEASFAAASGYAE